MGELTIRYNKRREDFNSDREYDDYLEEVEDISALAARQFCRSHRCS